MPDTPPHRFAVPDGTGADDVVAALARAGPVLVERPVTRRRTFYDTFDWRVHAAGGALEVEEDGAGARLVWRGGDGLVRAEARLAGRAPRLAGDLPDGPLRDGLLRVLDVRALLPVAKVRTTTTSVRVLDGEGKTVARVAVDHDVAGSADLGRHVRLVPVRGYDRALGRVAALLAKDLGLQPAADDVLRTALAAAGRRAGDYSARVRVQLSYGTASIDAAGPVLASLLRVVEANQQGVRDDVDPEFLHDLRVAVRRTRTAVRALRGALPDAVADEATGGFRWAQQVTGPVRDLDVHLLDLAAAGGDLAPAVDLLRRRRAAEHRRLVRTLGSPRWRDLLAWWGRVVADPRASGPPGPEAELPVARLARDRIARADRRVRRAGRAIGDASPAEALHDLRKRAKELRYLLELFASVLPPDDLGDVVDELKALQENLGDFHDYDVQEAALRALAADLVAAGESPATVMAIGVLVEDLHRRSQHARAEFAGRFAAFDRPAARRRRDRLLGVLVP